MRRRVTVLCAALAVLLPVAATANAVPPQHPVFRDGEAQPVFDPARVVRRELFVTAPVDSDRDGHLDRVHAQVVRPAATERGLRVPVVYRASPYFAGGNDVPNHDVDTELHVPERPGARTARTFERDERAAAARIDWEYEQYFLARGYAVVYAESLGTGESTGCPTTGAPNETIGAKSVVDWLNDRAFAQDTSGRPVRADWSSGQVGMMGVSYNGTLPNAVASTGIEGLDAIVPIGAISNWYDYYRSDGAVVAPGGYQGEDADVLAKFVYTRADREICRPVIDEITADQDRISGDYNSFWDARNYLDDVGGVRAAVLQVHGLNDWNVKTRQAAQWYAALCEHGAPHKIWWHRSGHVDPIKLREREWLRELNRWFTRYLHDVPNGVEDEPRAVVQREDGSWIEEPEWPAPQAEPVELRPTAGGGRRGGLDARGADDAVVERLTDDATQLARELAAAASSPNRLAYFTAPLVEDARVSGSPRAELALSFDRPAANVTALLVDQAPDGSVSVITRGWADPQNRVDIGRSTPVEPGENYRITVRMQPDDHVFGSGHRLGLVVLSSDHEFTLRPKPGTGLRLDLSRTRLELPMVGGVVE